MQTFVPYKNFHNVAACLDSKRLGKQRVECKIILDLLLGHKDNSWKNHPAVRMWQGYIDALKDYMNIMIDEWIGRGYKNTMEHDYNIGAVILPPWLDDQRVIQSHRTNLLLKDPEHYGQFGWKNYNIRGYYWPVEAKTKQTKLICEEWTRIIDA